MYFVRKNTTEKSRFAQTALYCSRPACITVFHNFLIKTVSDFIQNVWISRLKLFQPATKGVIVYTALFWSYIKICMIPTHLWNNWGINSWKPIFQNICKLTDRWLCGKVTELSYIILLNAFLLASVGRKVSH